MYETDTAEVMENIGMTADGEHWLTDWRRVAFGAEAAQGYRKTKS